MGVRRMKRWFTIAILCSWLPVAVMEGQDAPRHELVGARVRARCCQSSRWVTGVATSVSDTDLTIESVGEGRRFSRSHPLELERSLGKSRAIVVWTATVGAAGGFAIGTTVGGGDRSDLSGALGRGLGGLIGFATGAVAGTIVGFIVRREEWTAVVDPWHFRAR
jgi:hypothetical protein